MPVHELMHSVSDLNEKIAGVPSAQSSMCITLLCDGIQLKSSLSVKGLPFVNEISRTFWKTFLQCTAELCRDIWMRLSPDCRILHEILFQNGLEPL